MGKLIDLTGKRFGRLYATNRIPGLKNKRVMYHCVCDCGKEIEVRSESLRNGHTQSCGCRHKDIVAQNSTKHGKAHTRLYRIWGSMIQRCHNSNDDNYKNYGGRGITVCDVWRNNFESFYQWAINNGYNGNLEIDREDNNRGYSPNNCRFVTRIENQRNRRCTKLVKYKNDIKPLAQLCEEMHKDYNLVLNRINNYGWSAERALST